MEKELMEKKNDYITRADEVLNKAKEEKRELTEAEAEELAEIRDNVRRIMKTLELKGEFDKMEGHEIEVEALPKDEERKCKDERLRPTCFYVGRFKIPKALTLWGFFRLNVPQATKEYFYELHNIITCRRSFRKND
jgi:predicted transcriptional regulator of viral defense system